MKYTNNLIEKQFRESTPTKFLLSESINNDQVSPILQSFDFRNTLDHKLTLDG